METKQRSRGTGSIVKVNGSRFWRLSYYCRGRQVRESSHTEVKAVAERMLRARLADIDKGNTPDPGAYKLTYEDLREGFMANYLKHARKSLYKKKDGTVSLGSLNVLDAFFKGWRVGAIASGVDKFILARQAEGAANGTINRCLAHLTTMFSLALRAKRIPNEIVPIIEKLPEAAPRHGFLTTEEFRRLRIELPDYLKAPVTLLWSTGMRKGEVQRLLWSNVNVDERMIALQGVQTKNGSPRHIPLDDEMMLLLGMLKREGEYVFGGSSPLGDFRVAWKNACKRAGKAGLLVHDLRRSAVRNFIRSGTSQSVSMDISGHKTDSVFRRYNITDDRDLIAAIQRRAEFEKEQIIAAEEAANENKHSLSTVAAQTVVQ